MGRLSRQIGRQTEGVSRQMGRVPTGLVGIGSGNYPQPMARDPKPPPPPAGRTMRAAHARQHEHGQGEGAVKAKELVEAAFTDGISPSAAARKVFVLLLAKAAGNAWQEDWFSITK